MKASKVAENIVSLFNRHRGIGTTEAAVDLVRKQQGTLVCLSYREALRVSKQYSISTINGFDDLLEFRFEGRNVPLVLDNSFVNVLLEEMMREHYIEVKQLRERIKELESVAYAEKNS